MHPMELSIRPVSYTHLDVYKRQEGSLAPVACVEEENTCEKIHDCATILVWQKMNEAINDVVDHMTLQMCIRDRDNLKSSRLCPVAKISACNFSKMALHISQSTAAL